MPGLEKLRFVVSSEKELDEFTCAICLAIFVNPVLTQCCRQIYCSDCIEQWLTKHDICPNDRKKLKAIDLKPVSRPFTNLLNKLQIKCEFESLGCSAIVPLDQLSNHIECHKCKTCGLGGSEYFAHNCIYVLQSKVKNLTQELTDLKEKDKNNNLFMSKVIERARIHINDCVLERRSDGISQQLVNKFIDKSKEMIRNYNTFHEIATHLYEQMQQLTEFSRSYRWNVVIYSPNVSAFTVYCKDSLRIRFNDLFIFLFSYRKT